jgi:hypothetical protein
VAATAAVTRLAIRAATYANLDSVALIASLLKALRSAGASDAVAVLTSRAGSAGISGTILDRPAEALWPGREPNEALRISGAGRICSQNARRPSSNHLR